MFNLSYIFFATGISSSWLNLLVLIISLIFVTINVVLVIFYFYRKKHKKAFLLKKELNQNVNQIKVDSQTNISFETQLLVELNYVSYELGYILEQTTKKQPMCDLDAIATKTTGPINSFMKFSQIAVTSIQGYGKQFKVNFNKLIKEISQVMTSLSGVATSRQIKQLKSHSAMTTSLISLLKGEINV